MCLFNTPNIPEPPAPPPPVQADTADPAAQTAADRIRRRAKSRYGKQSTILGGMQPAAPTGMAKTLLGS